MGIARCAVLLHSTTGLPEDDFVNTFHFTTPGAAPTTAECETIKGAVSTFYNVLATGQTYTVSQFIADVVSRTNQPTIKVYDQQAGGSPVFEEAIDAGFDNALVATNLPSQVACVLSFHADLSTSVEVVAAGAPGPAGDVHPKARRRGRIFLGPLCSTAGTGSPLRPYAELIEALTLSADDLMNDAALAADGLAWAVYSSKDDAARPVVGGWVDQRFDIQRRRAVSAGSRTTF